MIMRALLRAICITVAVSSCGFAAQPGTNSVSWLGKPLSLPEAIEIALRQNANILKGRADLESAYGLEVQTRALVLPKLRSSGNFTGNDPGLREIFPTTVPIRLPNETWYVDVKVVQSLYEGGRMRSALREANLTREQAVAQYEAVIADTVLDVQLAYYDVLLAGHQIEVQEASVLLLTN